MAAVFLIWILLDKVLKKIPAGVGVSVSFVLFLILRSWTKQDPIQLSDNLLNVTWLKSVLAYIGFPQAGFSSTDYFPLLPWIFLFATGYFLYSFLQEKGLINRLFGNGKFQVLTFIRNNYFKGGVGKSKLSTMFAYLTDKLNLKVLMIDKDLQATLTKDLAKTFKVELPRVNFYEGLKMELGFFYCSFD